MKKNANNFEIFKQQWWNKQTLWQKMTFRIKCYWWDLQLKLQSLLKGEQV
jgi:hypothetical protein